MGALSPANVTHASNTRRIEGLRSLVSQVEKRVAHARGARARRIGVVRTRDAKTSPPAEWPEASRARARTRADRAR
jgi:hypothetical protein